MYRTNWQYCARLLSQPVGQEQLLVKWYGFDIPLRYFVDPDQLPQLFTAWVPLAPHWPFGLQEFIEQD